MLSTEKELIQADSTPVLDTQSADEQIPDYAIQRLAHFFIPLMQLSLQESTSTYLQQNPKDVILAEKGEYV